MPLASELIGLVRFAVGLRSSTGFIAPDAARALIAERMRTRERRFLAGLDRAVFHNPRSPYRQLLRHAGADPGDVRALVGREGLDAALERLAAEGVCVTWDEFKGQADAVRGSRTFRFSAGDFDNPLTRAAFVASSGGSMAAPVRVRIDLEFIAQLAPNLGAWFDAQQWRGRPLVFWTPAHTGLATRYLMCLRIGYRYEKWLVIADMRHPLDRLRAATVHRLCQWRLGVSRGVNAGLDRIAFVLDTLHRMIQDGRPPLVNASPSAAARLSAAAIDGGRRLDGLTFILGAEPLTPERRAAIEAPGASCRATYGTSEAGWIGSQFDDATEHDEIHVFRDAYAVVPRSGDAAPPGPRTLMVTSLLDASPKVLLNTELGDSACVERTPGSAADRAFGYDLKLHTIRSFRKLTAFGITLAASDLYPILERTLPQRFGGSVGDYQLIEDQDGAGVSRLRLVIARAAGAVDAAAVRAALLDAIAASRAHYGFMAGIVDRAGALQVERGDPVRTAAGKVLPVHPAAGVRTAP